MTFLGLLFRNLFYHRRANFALFLGVALGAAILTGALLVGDSLRGSLKELTLDQMGWVERAMIPGRFFRDQLVNRFPDPHRSSILLLEGSACNTHTKELLGKVTILGVDAGFWPQAMKSETEFWQSSQAEAVINQSLAQALGLKTGDSLTIRLPKNEPIHRETLLGKRKTEDVVKEITLKVRTVWKDEGMARFTLRPSPDPVRNVFIPITYLQEKLDLKSKANALLLGANPSADPNVSDFLTLEDWGLKLRGPKDRAQSLIQFLDPRNTGELKKFRWQGRIPPTLEKKVDAKGVLHPKDIFEFYETERPYLVLESQQLILSPAVVKGAREASQSLGLTNRPGLVYLADKVSVGNPARQYPYVVVADFPLPLPELKPDEAILMNFDSQSKPKEGDLIEIDYYQPDERNHLVIKKTPFRLQSVLELGGVFDDPDWTPEFPGITDKLDMANWENPPFPYDRKRVKSADENFWKRYRATPRVWINPATAEKLWGTRFGTFTSVRFFPKKGDSSEKVQEDLAKALLQKLNPEAGGFKVQNIRGQILQATSGPTDFGVLFLAFSFFLITAALLLVGLLFRLHMDRRGPEMGLLLATGWTHSQVRGLLLNEGIFLALPGAAVGLLGAMVYGSFMLRLLASNWPGSEGLTFLKLHVTPMSLIIGYVASVAVSILTIFWAARILGKLSPRSLLSGETGNSDNTMLNNKPGNLSLGILLGCLGLAVIFIFSGSKAQGHEAKAGFFFGSGALGLIAGMMGIARWLKHSSLDPNPYPSLWSLGLRNAGRNRTRSLLTVGLLASATFLITAVEVFHHEPAAHFLKPRGGSGGFELYGETNVPFFQDLNDPQVRLDWNLKKEDLEKLSNVRFFPLRVRAGDDASCLNLFKPLKPRMVGIPADLAQEKRFHLVRDGDEAFGKSLGESMRESGNPIPAMVDANTAQWILKVSLDGEMEAADEEGTMKKLIIKNTLQESIFQSEVLVSEADFLKLYPRHEGFQMLMIDIGEQNSEEIRKILQKTLQDQGFEIRSTLDRLQGYLKVENTYLDTFKALGSFGLLLGSIGLAVVLLRSVWERRAELALLRALGFQGGQLAKMILVENLVLLFWGLVLGSGAAILAVAPHWQESGASLSASRWLMLLGSVVGVGLIAGILAIYGSLRTPLLTALRRE